MDPKDGTNGGGLKNNINIDDLNDLLDSNAIKTT